MMNHHVTSALAWPRVERPARSASSETVGKAAEAVEEAMEEEALVFRALRAAAPGEEVCLYYGRLPSLQTRNTMVSWTRRCCVTSWCNST